MVISGLHVTLRVMIKLGIAGHDYLAAKLMARCLAVPALSSRS